MNITVMNFAMAVTPMVLGALADVAGTPVAIWTCIGISFFASLVNVPLMFKKGLGIPPKKLPAESRALLGEEKELVDKILRGEWIPAEQLNALNEQRENKGQPYLVIQAGKFKDDKHNLRKLRLEAMNDYKYNLALYGKYLEWINSGPLEELPIICERINHSTHSVDPEQIAKVQKEIGKWFVAYLDDAGYHPHYATPMIKQMIMSAFPVISHSEDVKPEELEQIILNSFRVFSNYVALEDSEQHTTLDVLSLGRSAIFRSSV